MIKKVLLSFSILIACFNQMFAQATIEVKVLSVQTLSNVDCDGLFLGNSDFVWEVTGTDNTLGLTNNNPALFGIF